MQQEEVWAGLESQPVVTIRNGEVEYSHEGGSSEIQQINPDMVDQIRADLRKKNYSRIEPSPEMGM